MKKLLSIILVCFVGGVSALTLLMNFQGAWESTTNYKAVPVRGTSTNATPVVTSDGNVYVMSNASAPVVGRKPASQPAAWTKIN